MGAIPPLAFQVVGFIVAVFAVWFVVWKIQATNDSDSSFSQQSSSAKRNSTTKRSRHTLIDLADRVDVPVEYLESLNPSYREVRIPKQGGGTRYLQVPDDDTKQIQRTILKRLLAALSSHPFCYGFEQGTSIVDAALPHTHRFVVIKMDIRRFFESTPADRVHDYFRFIGWDNESAKRLTELTTFNGYLPQGAPTSPRLSNLLNYGLDELLASIAAAHHGSYSRYADDITMSFDRMNGRRVRGVIQEVRRVLDKFGYTMHGKGKLKIYRCNQRQQVLGLVVNEGVRLPRKTRRWLRAVQHRLDNHRSATLTAEQLDGWLAFQDMVARQQNASN
ncbi:MAG: reverse transcriptase family protein [Fuerstiella sp.]